MTGRRNRPARRAPPTRTAPKPPPGQVILDSVLPYLVNRVAHGMTAALARDLRQLGFTVSHWRVLAVLDARRRSTIGELAAYAMIEQSTLSRLVERMAAKGLVERRARAGDGRVTEVALTARGQKTFAVIRPIALAHAARATDGLSNTDLATFRQVAGRILGNIDAVPVETRADFAEPADDDG